MNLVAPFWFKQRQAKAEEAGPNLVRVSGPNLKESFVGIREEAGRWVAFLRAAADEPDTYSYTASPHIQSAAAGWDTAFEIYRNQMII